MTNVVIIVLIALVNQIALYVMKDIREDLITNANQLKILLSFYKVIQNQRLVILSYLLINCKVIQI